ncbi:hypothetical protein IKP85_00305 [bacterium]|nr:hypothetical protein [bacterium]
MSTEFDFIDLYYLNDAADVAPVNSEISLAGDIAAMKSAHDVIEISDMSETKIAYTYAKFFEVLDEQGLEGLVNS